MDSPDDHQAVAAVLAGDVDAFAVLVKRYERPIYNLMHRMTGSREDALDLAQETFLRAYEKLDAFRSNHRFFPWLYAIGLNHGRNFMRRKRGVVEFREELSEAVSEEERLTRAIDHERVRVALGNLPEDYREALLLHYREGLSMADVGTCLGISTSGAKMRIHRGIRKLRFLLMGKCPGPISP